MKRIVAVAALALGACAFNMGIRPSIEDSRWQVRSINGAAMPASPTYQIEFAGGRISGRFGCNRFSAPYSLGAEAIVVGGLETTEMGCDAATMAHESAGWPPCGAECCASSGLTSARGRC